MSSGNKQSALSKSTSINADTQTSTTSEDIVLSTDIHPQPSRYLRNSPDNLAVRRWAARALLAADLESLFSWHSLDQVALSLFERFDLPLKAQLPEDVDIIRPWIERQLKTCRDTPLDPSDPFTVNTQCMSSDLALNSTDLAILRFALSMGQCVPLRKCVELLGSDLSFNDAISVIAHILGLNASSVRKSLSPNGRLRSTGLLGIGHIHRGIGSVEDWAIASDV